MPTYKCSLTLHAYTFRLLYNLMIVNAKLYPIIIFTKNHCDYFVPERNRFRAWARWLLTMTHPSRRFQRSSFPTQRFVLKHFQEIYKNIYNVHVHCMSIYMYDYLLVLTIIFSRKKLHCSL